MAGCVGRTRRLEGRFTRSEAGRSRGCLRRRPPSSWRVCLPGGAMAGLPHDLQHLMASLGAGQEPSGGLLSLLSSLGANAELPLAPASCPNPGASQPPARPAVGASPPWVTPACGCQAAS